MNTDNRIAAILSDGADVAVIASTDVASRVSAMTSAASTLAIVIGQAEVAAEMSAKDWGCNYLNLVKVHGHDGDTLAQQSREAMGWKDLAGPVGAKIKTRFNTLRSRAGVISGRWPDLNEDQRTALLGGIKSLNTVYSELEKADREAKKKAEADKAAAEKALETASEPAARNQPEASAPADLILALTGMIETATIEEFAAFAEDFSVLFAAFDKRVNEAAEAGTLERVAA